jgi:hypothetical protein
MMKSNAQICGIAIAEIQRPDTITTYLFTDHTLQANQLPDAKPLSNYGFSTRMCDVKWLITTKNPVDDIISRTILANQQCLLTDTLNIRIFKKHYSGLLFRERRTYSLLFFRNQRGRQDIFFATFKKRRRLIPILQYLESNLQ